MTGNPTRVTNRECSGPHAWCTVQQYSVTGGKVNRFQICRVHKEDVEIEHIIMEGPVIEVNSGYSKLTQFISTSAFSFSLTMRFLMPG